MKTALAAGARGLLAVQRWIMFLSCALIIVGLFSEVVLRYAFGTSILGMNELIVIPALWMYFIGASYASHQGSHISANVLQVYLRGERARAVLRLVIAVISLGLALVFTWWGVLYLVSSAERGGTTSVFGLPLLLSQSAVTCGFVLMTLYALTEVLRAAREVRDAGEDRALAREEGED
ncbi:MULTISPECIES: TRAP transporter small permease [Brevibacterium]|uniref:Tripartite ATP-independent periplasmic transporters DctQ component domain-containing protein n=1 Tax=Brevibacterium salitolerans TaxID=1403566 RepID=A0ABN2X4T8_9MICO|nr:TRAP transporter small permease [Brevibacterium sp.]